MISSVADGDWMRIIGRSKCGNDLVISCVKVSCVGMWFWSYDFHGIKSITAIDHWLFNNKCEKESWNVNLKVKNEQ